MNNVGQKYVYYAPSQLENTDKLRTLLGLFWHHDAENNQTRYGFYYNPKTKKRIERVMKNYVDGLYERERALVGDLPQRDAKVVRTRFRRAMLDGSLPEQLRQSGDMKFRLPANWFRIRRRYGFLGGYDAVTETSRMGQDGILNTSVTTISRGFSGDAEHEVYEVRLNHRFSENMKFSPVVVLGKRLQDDDKYRYSRYKNWARVDNKGRSYGEKPNAKQKFQSELGRRGTRHFVIKHMFNRLQRHINNTRGQRFQDYYFEMTAPVDKILADKMNSGAGNIKVSNASQDCHYNYYLENYEKRIADNPDILETHMPNPYIVNSPALDGSYYEGMMERFRAGADASEFYLLRNIATLWWSIDQNKVSLRVGKNDEQVIKSPRRIGLSRKKKRKSTNANSAYMEYLEEYAEHFPALEQRFKDRISQNQSNIIFGAKNYALLQDVTSKSNNMPMGAMIEFTTQKTNFEDLTKKLTKSGLTSIIMQKALEHTLELQENAETFDSYYARTGWTTDFPSMRVTEYHADRPALMARVLPKDSKMMKSDGFPSFDLLKLLERIAKSSHEPGILAVFDMLDDRVDEVSTVIHDGSELSAFQNFDGTVGAMNSNQRAKKTKTSLAAFILLGQLKKMAKQTERSWQRLTAGSLGESRNEIVFYEIEKRRVLVTGQSEVIQRFWVPNFEDQETIKFFDSQVKYDGTYKYTIHSWVAVFGTNYSYTGMAEDFDKDPNGRWAFGVLTDPFIKLMRLPYKTLEPIQIRDFPPVPPNVDIIPYRATPDKFIINFNAGVDNFLQKPQAILGSDFDIFDKCYRSQYGVEGSRLVAMFSDKPEENAPLRFKSDDLPKFFQVFRTEDYAPKKWEDFSDSLSSQLNVEDGETSSIEYVTPNTDYYYMFRSVDIHGNVSNPSPIYKVRINDGQGIFTEVEPYDFEKDRVFDRSFAKKITKTVQITPVFEQIVFKDDRQPESKKTIANQQKIRLGVAQDSIYGKKLKFRITSRKSGRKIDLNVSFTHTHKKPQRD